MGFFKEFFSNLDEPAIEFQWASFDNTQELNAKALIEENEILKQELLELKKIKRLGSIETEAKLLE